MWFFCHIDRESLLPDNKSTRLSEKQRGKPVKAMPSMTVKYRAKTDTLEVETGVTLYRALIDAGYVIDAPCAGNGQCGRCRVSAYGALTPPSARELALLDGQAGLRLACMARIEGDCGVTLTGQPRANIRQDEIREPVRLDPPAFSKGEDAAGVGAAIDIGTTTVAVYLYDLKNGALLGTLSAVNAQQSYGADVISRINACISDARGLDTLTRLIRAQINQMLRRMLKRAGRQAPELVYLSVAGNTVMQHIFCGLSPRSIATAPFRPASLFGHTVNAHLLGISAGERAQVYLLPAVSGYVGGDITAGLLSSGAYREENCLFVDIGTNGEIALGGKHGFLCCAAAAGPAFEGRGISCGMGGVSGAVSRVTLKNGRVGLETIGRGRPAGICGSGIIDALHVMRTLGALDETGRLLPESEAPEAARPYLRGEGMDCRFVLNERYNLSVSAMDVRTLQLAKAAVAGAILTLMKTAGITHDRIRRVYLAGGFGSAMDVKSACAIGLIPAQFEDATVAAGNCAGMGAAMALLSKAKKRKLSQIQKSCCYIELSESTVFMQRYIGSMHF